jgi:hypothetical protein
MANSKLLKEAIADAKAVRETAIANAKIALEEAFTPRLQSILSKKLQSEMEGEEEDADVNEEYGVEDTSDADSSEIGDGDNKQPADDANDSSDLAQTNPDTETETAPVGEEEEDYEVVSEGEEDDVPGETQSRIEEEDEDELDLESIIRELESELEEDEDEISEEDEVETEGMEFDSKSAAFEGKEVAMEGKEVAVEGKEFATEGEEVAMDEEDEIDLDEILREMGYGDDEEETNEGEEMDVKSAALESELEEAYSVIKSLKSTINEVNLLNAKLLYTNKLFRSYDLTNEQKHKVVETLDRTQNVREVKLVFSTLAESMKIGGTSKKVKSQAKLTESFASKPVASTAPKKQIIAESNSLAERFKQLANIK